LVSLCFGGRELKVSGHIPAQRSKAAAASLSGVACLSSIALAKEEAKSDERGKSRFLGL